MKKAVDELNHFFFKEIWKNPLEKSKGLSRIAKKLCRSIIVAFHGFFQNQCFLRASALTFYSMMSIVPVLAVLTAIAKGFGFQRNLEEELLQRFPEQQETVVILFDLAQNLLENTRGGILTFVGIIVLFWSVIKVLSHIESSFNRIWGIKKQRTWIRRFTDFVSLMILAPIFFLSASSITVLVVTRLQAYFQELAIFPFLKTSILFVVELIPILLIWILFSLLYLVIPNTKVQLRAAVLGGVFVGTILGLLQGLYIFFQVGITKYSAIYGSLAALPLFLIWLQISWFVVLLGAELAFAYQNIYQFEFGWHNPFLNLKTRILLGVWVMQQAILCLKDKQIIDKYSLQKKLRLPMRSVEQVLDDLIHAGLLAEVYGDKCSYLPNKPTEDLKVKDVIDGLMEQKQVVTIPEDETIKRLYASLEKFDELIASSKENYLLKELPDNVS